MGPSGASGIPLARVPTGIPLLLKSARPLNAPRMPSAGIKDRACYGTPAAPVRVGLRPACGKSKSDRAERGIRGSLSTIQKEHDHGSYSEEAGSAANLPTTVDNCSPSDLENRPFFSRLKSRLQAAVFLIVLVKIGH